MIEKISEILDTDKPILICGWNKVKKLYPNQKITNKRISDNIFWTFSEKEKRTENSNDIENFKKYCIEDIDRKYKYYFLNPFELDFPKFRKIITKINSLVGDRYCFFDGKHFFILTENVILGVNLDFFVTNKKIKERIINWLKLKNFNIFEDSSIFNIKEVENKKYLMPVLLKEKYEKQLIIGYIFE